MYKTKTIMILGFISLLAVTSCRCDFDADEPENRDKNSETQNLRQYTSENDTLYLSLKR